MTTRGFDSLQKRLEKLKGDLDDAGKDAADDALDATERNAKRRIIEQDAVQTADLYRGFVQSTVEIPKGTRKTLRNTEAHANVVEWGSGEKYDYGSPQPSTGPFKAPSFGTSLVRAIREWIIEKPSFRPEGRGKPLDAAVGIAQVISGNAEGRRSGMKPRPFMRPAWRRGRWVLRRELNKNKREALR